MSHPMLSAGHYQVLRTLSHEGPHSRTELARLLGISKASISSLVRDLLEQNILCEENLVFGAGRPSISLAVRADAACFIGISLQADPAVLLLTDLHGTVHARLDVPRLSDPLACLATLADAVTQLRSQVGAITERLSGIGIAFPGFVSRDRHTCVTSTALGWQDIPFGQEMTERTNLPTWVENDANALILGEELFGPLRGSPDFSMLFVSHGIGCAHIVNGSLLRGHTGGAGEISHAPVMLEAAGALPCRCGNRGCLETVGSLLAITNAALNCGLPTSISELASLAANGNQQALDILHRAGSAVGLATAQLVQMLDPSHVVIMLHPALHHGVFGHALRHETETHILHRANARTLIQFRDFAPDSFAQGAASLAARYFLSGHDTN
ncbi:MAG: ROK family transcriptional regulator [Acetobacter sp.]|jgi:predicted NBD/HSP70 family sugar kinase